MVTIWVIVVLKVCIYHSKLADFLEPKDFLVSTKICVFVFSVYLQFTRQRSSGADEDADSGVLCPHSVHQSEHCPFLGPVLRPRISLRRTLLQSLLLHTLHRSAAGHV